MHHRRRERASARRKGSLPLAISGRLCYDRGVHIIVQTILGKGREPVERLVRVGEKLIDRERLVARIDEILKLRASGWSQQDAAERFGLDRSFVSRLESLGELRKGRRVALVGFPLGNKDELEAVARACGVEFVLLMTNAERWEFARSRDGVQLINEIMALVARLREFDVVVFVGSDMRIRMASALLGDRLVPWELGRSPLDRDYQVDPDRLRSLLSAVTGDGDNRLAESERRESAPGESGRGTVEKKEL